MTPQKILGSELPDDAFELLNEGTTTVIATVDEDGHPRTVPLEVGLASACHYCSISIHSDLIS